MAAKKQSGSPPMSAFEAADDTERLSPEEQAALAEESAGTTPEAPTAPEQPAQSQEVPAEQQQPSEQQPEAAQQAKEPTAAQKRIQGLIESNKQLRQQLSQQQEQWARLDERRKQMTELQEQAQRQAEQARLQQQRPDPDIDPDRTRMWDLEQANRQLQDRIRGFEQFQQQYQQQSQQQQWFNQVEGWRANQEAVFQGQHPDYPQAVEHLHQARVRHYQLLGFDPGAAENMWQQERFAHIAQAAQNQARGAQVDFGQYVYELARSVGYQPPQANGGQRPNGQAPQVIPGPQERVQQLQRAQQMQGLGGKLPAAETDQYSNIRAMPAQQLAQWLDANFPDGEDLMALANTNPTLYKILEQRLAELG